MSGRNLDNEYRARMEKATAELCAILREYGQVKSDWSGIEGIDCDGRFIRHRVRVEGYEPTGLKAERTKAALLAAKR